MVGFINEKRSELIDICQKSQVRRLYLFGSVMDNRFDSDNCDFDFLVSFVGRHPTV